MKRYPFSTWTHISLLAIIALLVLSNLYLCLVMIHCRELGCLIGTAFLVTIPATVLFSIFYWLGQKNIWCLSVLIILTVVLAVFSMMAFIDPAELEGIKWYFLLAACLSTVSFISLLKDLLKKERPQS